MNEKDFLEVINTFSAEVFSNMIPFGSVIKGVHDKIKDINHDKLVEYQFLEINKHLQAIDFKMDEIVYTDDFLVSFEKNIVLIYSELSAYKRTLYGNYLAHIITHSESIDWTTSDFYMQLIDKLPDMSLVAFNQLMNMAQKKDNVFSIFTYEDFRVYLGKNSDFDSTRINELSISLKQLESQGLISAIQNSPENNSGFFAYRLTSPALDFNKFISTQIKPK